MAKGSFAGRLAGLFGGGKGAGAQPDAGGYATGQVWQYRTRPGDEGSLLKIQQVEAGGDAGPICHISIIGVHVGPDGTINDIAHAPVSATTLDKSVTELAKTSARFQDVKPGIADWRAAKGGVFTLSVAEIVDTIDGVARNAG